MVIQDSDVEGILGAHALTEPVIEASIISPSSLSTRKDSKEMRCRRITQHGRRKNLVIVSRVASALASGNNVPCLYHMLKLVTYNGMGLQKFESYSGRAEMLCAFVLWMHRLKLKKESE